MRNKQKGAVIAMAVAGLFMAGKAFAEEGTEQPKKAEAAKVCCDGANACQGKSACGGADHACAGKNSCKGKGWIKADSAEACSKAGGKAVDCPKG